VYLCGWNCVQEQMKLSYYGKVLSEVKSSHGCNTTNFPHFLVLSPSYPLGQYDDSSKGVSEHQSAVIQTILCWLNQLVISSFPPAKEKKLQKKISSLLLLSRKTWRLTQGVYRVTYKIKWHVSVRPVFRTEHNGERNFRVEFRTNASFHTLCASQTEFI